MAKGSILDALYYGELVPWEAHHPDSADDIVIREGMNVKIKELRTRLSENDNELLNQIFSDRALLEVSAISNGFQDGFRLGGKIMIEILECSTDKHKSS